MCIRGARSHLAHYMSATQPPLDVVSREALLAISTSTIDSHILFPFLFIYLFTPSPPQTSTHVHLSVSPSSPMSVTSGQRSTLPSPARPSLGSKSCTELVAPSMWRNHRTLALRAFSQDQYQQAGLKRMACSFVISAPSL